MSGILVAIPYRAISELWFSVGSSFMILMDPLTASTKALQCSAVVSVMTSLQPDGRIVLLSTHLKLFYKTSHRAMQLIWSLPGRVTMEIRDEVWIVPTFTSGHSFFRASMMFFCAPKISLACSTYCFLPILQRAAQVPATIDPGLLPAIEGVA